MTRKKKNNPKGLFLVGLTAALILLAIVFFRGGGGERLRHLTDPLPIHPSESDEEVPELKTVTLFFLSEDDGLLHAEERVIRKGDNAVVEMQRLVEELIKGSRSRFLAPLPPETQVRQVFLTRDGTAYVDFSSDVIDKYAYGSSSELTAVYAVVNTLSFNYPEVKTVCILVEGAEKETLGGHIDLSRPFVPQLSLVAR